MKKYKYYTGSLQLNYNPNLMMKKSPYYNLNAQPDYTDAYNIASQYQNQHAMVKGFVKSAGNVAIGIKQDTDEAMDAIASAATGGATKGMITDNSPKMIDTQTPNISSSNTQKQSLNNKSKNLNLNMAKKGKYKLKYFKGGNAIKAAGDLANMAGTTIQAGAMKDNGEVDSAAQAGGMALEGAGMGASIGMVGGPIGAAIGAGVGAIGGAIYGGVSADEQNLKVRKARRDAELAAISEQNNAKASGIDVTRDMQIKDGIKNIKYEEGVSLSLGRKEKDPKGGLTQKGINKYNSETGSNLKMAVTTKPSELKEGSEDANRRKSFCARMGGVKGAMIKPNGESSRKKLALDKWNCKHGCGNMKKYKYKNGTREILTEDREAHFIKSNGKYKLLNDVTKPVTHDNNKNEGRNATVVSKSKYKLKDIINHNKNISNNPKDSLILPEGTSIITANKGLNKIALNAYKNRDYKTIDKLINKMPKDKFFNGLTAAELEKKAKSKTVKKKEKPIKSTTNTNTFEKDDEYNKDSKWGNNTWEAQTNRTDSGAKNSEHADTVAKRNKLTNLVGTGDDETNRLIKEGTLKEINGVLAYKNDITGQWEQLAKKRKFDNIPNKSAKDSTDIPTPDISDKVQSLNTDNKVKDKNKPTNSLGLDDDGMLDLIPDLRLSDANNILRGSRKPEKDPLFIPDLTLEKYVDLSDPNRRNSKEKEFVDSSNARNLSGGNVGNFRANRNQASADNYKNQQDINNFEIGQVHGVNQRNVDRKNNFGVIKSNAEKEQYTNNMMNRDKNEDLVQTGLKGFDENNYRNASRIRDSRADNVRNQILTKEVDLAKDRDKRENLQYLENAKKSLNKNKDKQKNGVAKLNENINKNINKSLVKNMKYKYKK